MQRKKKTVLPVLIWRSTLFMPRTVRRLVRDAVPAHADSVYRVHRPSLLVVLALFVVGVLMAGGALFVANNMFINRSVPPTPLRLILVALFFGLGLVFLLFALRIGSKRLLHRKCHLLLHPDCLLERNAWRVTLIPRERLLFAWGRRELRLRGADLTYDAIGWRDADGETRVYDLKDHYWPAENRHRAMPHDWNLIRQVYRLGGPPPGFHGRPRR